MAAAKKESVPATIASKPAPVVHQPHIIVAAKAPETTVNATKPVALLQKEKNVKKVAAPTNITKTAATSIKKLATKKTANTDEEESYDYLN